LLSESGESLKNPRPFVAIGTHDTSHCQRFVIVINNQFVKTFICTYATDCTHVVLLLQYVLIIGLCLTHKLAMNLPALLAYRVSFVCYLARKSKLCLEDILSDLTLATDARFILLPRHHLHHPFRRVQDDPRLEEIDNIAALH
jgi:hypothetical protein